MLSDNNISSLIRIIETQSERDSEASTPRKPTTTPLPISFTSAIISYLLDPYEHGFWDFRADWNTSSPLSKYLIDKLDILSELDGTEKFGTVSIAFTSRKISEEKRAELLRVSNRLSAINALFQAALEKSVAGSYKKINERDNWIEKINLSEIPEKFPDAWKVFTEQIYFEEFRPGIGGPGPYQIKAGLITLLEAPRTSNSLRLVAMQSGALSALQSFYSAIGVIENSSIRRIFAPDEDLFRPYFALVSSVLPHLVHDGQISRLFQQSLAYYEDDDFQHCISSLGLIAEDYLQRIYTTVLREALPGGLTLGQTVERLHKRLEELLPQQKSAHSSPDVIYDKIKSLESDANAEALKPILRDLLGLLVDDRNHYARRFDELTKPSSRRSIFPTRIADRLNELLKWRNAASHNSRIPLGAHEADRTLFCLIGVITWWQDRLSILDWSLGRIPLVEQLLQEAKAR